MFAKSNSGQKMSSGRRIDIMASSRSILCILLPIIMACLPSSVIVAADDWILFSTTLSASEAEAIRTHLPSYENELGLKKMKRDDLRQMFPYGGYPPPSDLTKTAQAQYVLWITTLSRLRKAGLQADESLKPEWTSDESRMILRLPQDFQSVCRHSDSYGKRYEKFVSGATSALPGAQWWSSTSACLEAARSLGISMSATQAQEKFWQFQEDASEMKAIRDGLLDPSSHPWIMRAMCAPFLTLASAEQRLVARRFSDYLLRIRREDFKKHRDTKPKSIDDILDEHEEKERQRDGRPMSTIRKVKRVPSEMGSLIINQAQADGYVNGRRDSSASLAAVVDLIDREIAANRWPDFIDELQKLQLISLRQYHLCRWHDDGTRFTPEERLAIHRKRQAIMADMSSRHDGRIDIDYSSYMETLYPLDNVDAYLLDKKSSAATSSAAFFAVADLRHARKVLDDAPRRTDGSRQVAFIPGFFLEDRNGMIDGLVLDHRRRMAENEVFPRLGLVSIVHHAVALYPEFRSHIESALAGDPLFDNLLKLESRDAKLHKLTRGWMP